MLRAELPKKSKWFKPYADQCGLRPVLNKIDGALESWDYLPIGRKIRNMERLHETLLRLGDGKPSKFPREFGFRFPAEALRRSDWATIEARVGRRLQLEKNNLSDMENVFSRWSIAHVKASRISHPYRMQAQFFPEHDNLIVFASPTMAKWYEKNVLKPQRRASKLPLPDMPRRLVYEHKSFGIGGITPLENDVVRIDFVQPLRFYKKLYMNDPGIGTPLRHPELLMLYAQLKHAENLGAKEVHLWKIFHPEFKEPYDSVYKKLIKLASSRKALELAAKPTRMLRKMQSESALDSMKHETVSGSIKREIALFPHFATHVKCGVFTRRT
jgi:hypothetical protein